MKATMRNSRNGSAKHNDRDFDLTHERNDGHIDINRQDQNIYWHHYENEDITFYEAEQKYYKEHYQATVKHTNDKAKAARHKERQTTLSKMYNNKRTQPEETILQIGNVNETVDAQTFTACVQDYIAELQKYDQHIHILDWAIHADEAVPHAHIRKVYDYIDDEGFLRISARKALELEGFERPMPDQPESVLNNNKMTFDKHMRNTWYDICEKHDLVIEREPDFSNTSHREMDTYVREQQKDAELKLAQTVNKLQEEEQRLLQMQQQMQRLEEEYQEKQKKQKEIEQIMREDLKTYVKKTSRKHVKNKLAEQNVDVHLPHWEKNLSQH